MLCTHYNIRRARLTLTFSTEQTKESLSSDKIRSFLDALALDEVVKTTETFVTFKYFRSHAHCGISKRTKSGIGINKITENEDGSTSVTCFVDDISKAIVSEAADYRVILEGLQIDLQK